MYLVHYQPLIILCLAGFWGFFWLTIQMIYKNIFLIAVVKFSNILLLQYHLIEQTLEMRRDAFFQYVEIPRFKLKYQT